MKTTAAQRHGGAIQIQSVSHSYGRGRDEVTALGPVDLTVDPGAFLQPRLFPWRTVGGNVDLALKYAKVPREGRAEVGRAVKAAAA